MKFMGVGTAVLACALATVRAQSDAPPEAKPADQSGLLGHTYLTLAGGAMQIRNEAVKPTGALAAMDVNLPIDDGFDYHLNLGVDDAGKSGTSERDLQIDNAVAAYYRTRFVAPFVSAGFGYDWGQEKLHHVTTRDNRFLVEGGAGMEVPVGKATSVRLGANYDAGLRRPHSRALDYAVSANYWINDTVGTTIGATLRQGHGGAFDAMFYTAGIRFSFD